MKITETVLRYIIIGGLFALPFIVFIVADGVHFPYNLFFPFITGKNFTFRLIVELITGAWIALALYKPEYRPRKSLLLLAIAIFVGVIAVADAQGVNPFKSFWSNYERMDGWITLAHFLALTLVATSVLSTQKIWRDLWHTILAITGFCSLYGILQIIGVQALGQASGAGLNARVDGTFGNSIYLAAFLLFGIFIAVLHIYQEGNEKWSASSKVVGTSILGIWLVYVMSLLAHDSGSTIGLTILIEGAFVAFGAWFLFLRKKYLLIGLSILNTFILFSTGTRGTMLGLVGGAILSGLILALIQKSSRFRMWTVGAIVAVLVLAGALWAARDSAFVHSIGFLDRLASISLTDSTIHSRFLNMHIAWQGVKERPIFGWGQENYAIVFDKYYDPLMYGQEPWFDRVHDVIFDWLIAGGIVGLLSYLAIYVVALGGLWSATREKFGVRRISVVEASLFTGLFAAYFFHNLTVFDNITSYLMFALVLSYLAWRVGEAYDAPRILSSFSIDESVLPIIGPVAVVAALVVVWFVNVPALMQNTALLYALGAPGGPQVNFNYFKQALDVNSYGEQEAREQLAQISAQLAGNQNVSNDIKQQFFTLASAQMKEQEKVSPLDARFPLFEGILYDSYGDYSDGLAALQKAHDLSPQKQTILFQLAATADAMGNIPDAVKYLKDAYDADQNNGDAASMYVAELLRAKQDDVAAPILQMLINTDQATDVRIASALAQRGDYNQIASIWEQHIVKSPKDMQAYFTLAAAYYGAGDSAKAIDALKRAEAADPSSMTQAEQYISQIQSGAAKKP